MKLLSVRDFEQLFRTSVPFRERFCEVCGKGLVMRKAYSWYCKYCGCRKTTFQAVCPLQQKWWGTLWCHITHVYKERVYGTYTTRCKCDEKDEAQN